MVNPWYNHNDSINNFATILCNHKLLFKQVPGESSYEFNGNLVKDRRLTQLQLKFCREIRESVKSWSYNEYSANVIVTFCVPNNSFLYGDQEYTIILIHFRNESCYVCLLRSKKQLTLLWDAVVKEKSKLKCLTS